jgi:hypothetical protein
MKNNLQPEVLYQGLLEQMSDEPLVTYFKLFYRNPIGLLDEIKKIQKGEEISLATLAVSMDRFSSLYELFRPHPITHYDPYHGTVKTMEGIFSTLSSVFGNEFQMSFSKFGQTILDRVFQNQMTPKEDVYWEGVEEDIKYVSEKIDEKIAEHSLNNAYFYKYSYKGHYFFRSVLKDYLSKNSNNVVLDESSSDSVTIGATHVSLRTNMGIIEFKSEGNLARKLYSLEP